MGEANRSGTCPDVVVFPLCALRPVEFTVLPVLALAIPGLGASIRGALDLAVSGSSGWCSVGVDRSASIFHRAGSAGIGDGTHESVT
jgi:hypothetical protein